LEARFAENADFADIFLRHPKREAVDGDTGENANAPQRHWPGRTGNEEGDEGPYK